MYIDIDIDIYTGRLDASGSMSLPIGAYVSIYIDIHIYIYIDR